VAQDVPFCACVGDHRPLVLEYEKHHLWPIGMGGPEHKATLLLLCPSTHSSVHRILRDMVKNDWHPRRRHEPAYAHHVATLGYQAWVEAGRP